MFRNALGDADGVPPHEGDRAIGHEVREITLQDGILRCPLPQERDVGRAGLHGFQAVVDRRVDADLAVSVARAQHAVGRTVRDGRDDGMRRVAEAARDRRIVVRAVVDRRRYAFGLGISDVPADVQHEVGTAVRDGGISLVIRQHGRDIERDAEVALDAVSEIAQPARKLPIFIDVGKGALARDDDGMNDGMRGEIVALVLRQAQDDHGLAVGVHMRQRLDEEWPVRRHGVIGIFEAAEQRIIALAHDVVERRDLMAFDRRIERAATPRETNRHPRVEKFLVELRRLRDAGHGIELARAQARDVLFPGIGHERDLHACIARERLHVVRLDAIEIAGTVLRDDAVAERSDADAQEVARLCQR